MITPVYYVDTSVVGGRFDDEFRAGSELFWKQAFEGRYRLIVSTVVRRELTRAPEPVQQFFADEVAGITDLVEITQEIEDLGSAYLQAGVVTPRFRDDAVHVAAATISRARALVSWNFSHLVNIRREDAFNSVNLLNGYPTLRIVSPLEVIEHGE